MCLKMISCLTWSGEFGLQFFAIDIFSPLKSQILYYEEFLLRISFGSHASIPIPGMSRSRSPASMRVFLDPHNDGNGACS